LLHCDETRENTFSTNVLLTNNWNEEHDAD